MLYDSSKLYAVIMAGGRGERFWPAGRSGRPKQLLNLVGKNTMIEETVQRLFPMFSPEHILVITNISYVEQIRGLLTLPAENIIGEPVGRDTAPCAALAAALIRRMEPEAVMVMLPADHVIRPAKMFQNTLAAAVQQAQTGMLVTLGIQPSSPATGYGYIHCGDMISPGFHHVLEFREKPDHSTAEQFFQDGSYKWNSGIFIWKAESISEAFRKYTPALAEKMDRWANGADYAADFAECEKISIDYAVMEKADNVLVGDAPFYWNDIGSWSALRSQLPLDDQGNAVRGKVIPIDSSNNILISDDRTLLGVIGLNDIAVVKSGNGILVCPISEEQRVKTLTNKLKTDAPEFL